MPSDSFRNSTSQFRNAFIISPSSSAITSSEGCEVYLALNTGSIIVAIRARFAGTSHGTEDCGVPVVEEGGAIAAGRGSTDAEVESAEFIPAAPIGAKEGLDIDGVRVEGHCSRRKVEGWDCNRN